VKERGGPGVDVLVIYRLIDPGSEWRLHREWYERSAMGDLLGKITVWLWTTRSIGVWTRFWRIRGTVWSFATAMKDLFGARFEVLLYDLTSTYFESDPPLAMMTSASTVTVGTSVRTVCKW